MSNAQPVSKKSEWMDDQLYSRTITQINAKLAALDMVDIGRMQEDWLIEMRYAGTDNFVGRVLYPSSVCLLMNDTAKKLSQAHRQFKQYGYRLKIWDAYRPSSYQRILYDAAQDKSFVAHPNTGSKHSRGAAVDVTLVDATGKELAMPTGFDAFVPQAALQHPTNTGTAKAHATLLKDVMEGVGFCPLDQEWWHFDDQQWRNYAITDHDLTEFEMDQL